MKTTMLVISLLVAFITKISATEPNGNVLGCSSSHKSSDGTITVLEALGKRWPADGFCRAHSSSTLSTPSYQYTVSLDNMQARGGQDFGHPGVMFNVIDDNNYDVIYFRPHSASSCYQTGYVEQSQFHGIQSKTCPNGPPKGQTWFTVHVDVAIDGIVSVFLDGHEVVKYSGHYPVKASVGVVVANGYENVINFKDASLTEGSDHEDPKSDILGCSNSYNSPDGTFTVLEALGKRWPADGFCRAHYPLTLPTSSYQYTVSLNNMQARNGQMDFGHPGVMFNVIDENHYDVIYFRPHSASSCYQTGYVELGQFQGIQSKSCPAGPPKGQTWFTVRVDVACNGLVSVLLDDQEVLKYIGHYPARVSVGVVVANGYENIVDFKNEILTNESLTECASNRCVHGSRECHCDRGWGGTFCDNELEPSSNSSSKSGSGSKGKGKGKGKSSKPRRRRDIDLDTSDEN